MIVYLEEKDMPKDCVNCKFYEYEIEYNGEWGFETHRRMCKINGSLIQGICPLHSLSDYTKQVRKEVVQEIKKKAELFGVCKTGIIKEEYRIDKEVLDQIEQGKTK